MLYARWVDEVKGKSIFDIHRRHIQGIPLKRLKKLMFLGGCNLKDNNFSESSPRI